VSVIEHAILHVRFGDTISLFQLIPGQLFELFIAIQNLTSYGNHVISFS